LEGFFLFFLFLPKTIFQAASQNTDEATVKQPIAKHCQKEEDCAEAS
jgi:hypothetical protein